MNVPKKAEFHTKINFIYYLYPKVQKKSFSQHLFSKNYHQNVSFVFSIGIAYSSFL